MSPGPDQTSAKERLELLSARLTLMQGALTSCQEWLREQMRLFDESASIAELDPADYKILRDYFIGGIEMIKLLHSIFPHYSRTGRTFLQNRAHPTIDTRTCHGSGALLLTRRFSRRWASAGPLTSAKSRWRLTSAISGSPRTDRVRGHLQVRRSASRARSVRPNSTRASRRGPPSCKGIRTAPAAGHRHRPPWRFHEYEQRAVCRG